MLHPRGARWIVSSRDHRCGRCFGIGYCDSGDRRRSHTDGRSSRSDVNVDVQPQTLITPATASCTINLTSSPATTVSLTLGYSVSNAEVTMPTSITVPAGATSASFNVQVAAITAQTSLIVTASLNSSFTISLQPPSNPVFTPIRVNSGGAAYTDQSTLRSTVLRCYRTSTFLPRRAQNTRRSMNPFRFL